MKSYLPINCVHVVILSENFMLIRAREEVTFYTWVDLFIEWITNLDFLGWKSTFYKLLKSENVPVHNKGVNEIFAISRYLQTLKIITAALIQNLWKENHPQSIDRINSNISYRVIHKQRGQLRWDYSNDHFITYLI